MGGGIRSWRGCWSCTRTFAVGVPSLCGLAAHWLHAVHLLKVPAVNGTVLAVTIFSQIQIVLSCILLAATIFWTCIKIVKALRDFHREG